MSGLSSPSPAKLKVLVVDDEEVARERLKRLLQHYRQHVEVIGEAGNGEEALTEIVRLRPDVVFLDIEMPGKNGLQVLREMPYLPLIVFVTAYEQYAVKAFEENSLDYLLKPVEQERLEKTMQRLQEKQHHQYMTQPLLQQLMEKLQPPKELKVIPVKTGDRIQLVPVSDVVFFEAKDKYVNMHLESKVHLLDQSLAYLEERLPEEFIRVQRGYIINQHKIKDIRKYFNGGYIFEMANAAQTKIKSGNTYNDSLKRLFYI